MSQDHETAPCSILSHLGLLEVQVLADGGEQPAQALQGLLVVVLEQLDHAVVHDGLRQHLELEQLADELDVADGAPPSLVLGLLQLLLQPVALRRLREARKHTKRGISIWPLSLGCMRRGRPGARTDAAESSSFCFLSNTTSSTLSFSNSFWQRFSSSFRKLTVLVVTGRFLVGLSAMGTLSWTGVARERRAISRGRRLWFQEFLTVKN